LGPLAARGVVTMLEILHRIWFDLIGRFGGPMSFRVFLQPTMALIFAIRDGVKDAKTNRTPYFWTITHGPKEKRRERLKEGVKATSRIFVLGIIMDVIYQIRVFHTFYPFEALDIAIILAFIPYLIFRGPVNRIARWWLGRRHPVQH
jgi:hypothetical protein